MDYQKASQYWVEKDAKSVHMDKDALLKIIDGFLKEHNTLALATASEGYVRCTPVEYNYYDGYFYLFSEGGKKFINLEKNKEVSFAIFDSYQGFGKIHSLQVQATCEIIDPESEEFASICAKKGLNLAALKKMGAPFHLLKLIPHSYDFLDSDLKKYGYSNRQHLDF